MNAVMDEVRRRDGLPWFFAWVARLDGWLLLVMLLLMAASLVILQSASASDGIILRQSIRFAGALVVFITLMLLPPPFLRKVTPLLYVATLGLLILVEVAGVSAGGAKRWLNLGVARIQPSELAKISVPMMVVWYLTIRHTLPSVGDVLAALIIIALPVALILAQPDLGTALLVGASGVIALFLAGLSWRMIALGAVLIAIAAPLFWFFGIKDYQRERVLTLFNPDADQFGAGWHIIQSQIAIGSGGISGKGYMQGTQSQLEFLPESSTDFIFAVIAEELGLFGVSCLLIAYGILIFRGLYLSTLLGNRFARVVAASIFLTFFINIFVNIGMVSGFLPVVGLPLAFISYGGSSIFSLMAGFAIAMNLIGGYRQSPEQEHL
ncbi:MAG: rod shape-determining protein RodA [Cardiobacteriaceae bacterium]|nr:rod shape-determining protein RodA [Cardiobacteriaceae bacterium]